MIENKIIKEKYFEFLNKYTDESKKDVIQERKYVIKHFIDFLDSIDVMLPKITSNEMISYISFLTNYKTKNNKSYSSHTVRTKFSYVSTFLQFCFEYRFIDEHKDRIVTSNVKSYLPTVTRKIKSFITFNVMKLLFKDCERKHESLFRLMYNTGARVSAICNIKISDIDFNEKTLIFFERKTHVENIIILADSTIKAIKDYIELYRKDLNDSSIDWLFVSNKKNKLSKRRIQQIVPEETSRVLGKRLTAHRFRDIAISHMIENDASITDVSLFASHKNIATTMRYYKQSKKHREKTMKKSHPLLQIENIESKKEKLDRREKEFDKVKSEFLSSMKAIEKFYSE